METLIEDLLKLSRVSRSELQRQQIDLSKMAESIASDLRKTDPQRAAEFVIEPGLHARGDERLLHVALDNLLRNAWKFTGKQPRAKIEVGSSKGPPQAFFVRDNGAGFDMAYSSRLFGVFQRLHTVSEFPGTGIGLATVQRIVNRHGGRVWATGEVNHGATFFFTLPSNENLWHEPEPAGTSRETK
jgi:light-regulated signal transduction histidine kinase (bacteriophytochrome)